MVRCCPRKAGRRLDPLPRGDTDRASPVLSTGADPRHEATYRSQAHCSPGRSPKASSGPAHRSSGAADRSLNNERSSIGCDGDGRTGATARARERLGNGAWAVRRGWMAGQRSAWSGHSRAAWAAAFPRIVPSITAPERGISPRIQRHQNSTGPVVGSGVSHQVIRQ